MTLQEALQPYLFQPNDTGLDKLNKIIRFTNLLGSLDGKDKNVTKLLDFVELIINQRRPTADALLDILEQYGIQRTIDMDLLWNWLDLTNQVGFTTEPLKINEDFYNLFKNNLETITTNEIRTYLQSQDFASDSTDVKFADSQYLIPKNLVTVEDIIHKYRCDRLTYIQQRRDCDDFAIMFKSFLSRHSLGNLTAGVFWARFYKEDGSHVYHAINLILYKDENGNITHKLYEPQSEMKFYDIGQNEKYIRIESTFIYF